MGKFKKSLAKIKSHSQQIGIILRKWMHLNSLSEADLARAAGLAKPTLRSYLDGRLITVNLETLERVCNVLKRTLPELMEQSSTWKGFIKTDSAAGKYNISNLNKYHISVECDIPLNAHLAGGYIHFYPNANYLKKDISEIDCWIYLECLGGVIAIEYNHQSLDLCGGQKIFFNGRYPFRFFYPMDHRNERKLGGKRPLAQRVTCRFFSAPVFWNL